MKRAFFVVLLAVIVLIAGIIGSPFGQTPSPKPADIDQRIANQQRRIDEGIRSRELTQSEAGMLQDNLNYVLDQTARLKADRSLTNEERERLHKMLDQNSDIIFDKKNNPVKRFY